MKNAICAATVILLASTSTYLGCSTSGPKDNGQGAGEPAGGEGLEDDGLEMPSGDPTGATTGSGSGTGGSSSTGVGQGGGSEGEGGGLGGGGGPLTVGCNDDGMCSAEDDDCVCADCDTDEYCLDPANCIDDGICDPYLEGCVCADCTSHPECG